MDKLPLLTMTKSRILSNIPQLSEESMNLLNTLSGLCSFYTVGDIASFIFSPNFLALIHNSESWIMFEIGVYKNHNLTLDLIPANQYFVLSDSQKKGGLSHDTVEIKSEKALNEVLTNWYITVIK